MTHRCAYHGRHLGESLRGPPLHQLPGSMVNARRAREAKGGSATDKENAQNAQNARTSVTPTKASRANRNRTDKEWKRTTPRKAGGNTASTSSEDLDPLDPLRRECRRLTAAIRAASVQGRGGLRDVQEMVGACEGEWGAVGTPDGALATRLRERQAELVTACLPTCSHNDHNCLLRCRRCRCLV